MDSKTYVYRFCYSVYILIIWGRNGGDPGVYTGSWNDKKAPVPEASVTEVMACLVGTNFEDEPSYSGKRLLVRSKFEEKNTGRRKMVEMGHKGVTECPPSVF